MICTVLCAAALIAGPAAFAQAYPAKPIRMIVGFAPGGGTDVTARAIVPELSEVQERFLTLGLDAVGNTPVEFAQFIKSDMDKWSRLVRELKLTMQ